MYVGYFDKTAISVNVSEIEYNAGNIVPSERSH